MHDKQKAARLFALASCALLLIAIIEVIAGAPLTLMYGTMAFEIVSLIGIVVGFAWIYIAEQNAKKQAEQEQKDRQQASEFYRTCIKNGLTDDAAEQDIKLIARNSKIPEQKAVELFKRGIKIKAEDQAIRKEAKLRQEHQKEIRRLEEDARRYKWEKECAQRVGWGKYLASLDKSISQKEKEIAEIEKKAEDSAKLSYLQKSQASQSTKLSMLDMAGIVAADGVAGPVAGAVTASQTMDRNATEQANRLDAANSSMELSVYFYGQAQQLKQELQQLKRKRDDFFSTSQHLVDDTRTKDLASCLSLELDSLTASSGNGLVATVVAYAHDVPELLGKESVLDGSLRIILSRNGETMGDGYLVTPGVDNPDANLEGIGFTNSPETTKISCMCLPSGETFGNIDDLEAEIEPVHLWLIQR